VLAGAHGHRLAQPFEDAARGLDPHGGPLQEPGLGAGHGPEGAELTVEPPRQPLGLGEQPGGMEVVVGRDHRAGCAAALEEGAAHPGDAALRHRGGALGVQRQGQAGEDGTPWQGPARPAVISGAQRDDGARGHRGQGEDGERDDPQRLHGASMLRALRPSHHGDAVRPGCR